MAERTMMLGDPVRNTRKGRVVAIDLLRLVATFQMVQGHTIDAILDTELRQGAAFDVWTWIRGLTSVAFLAAAGLSFHLTTLLRFDAHRGNPTAGRRRIRRGLVLIGIGYLLHLPVGANDWTEAWRLGTVVDVLQCIGVTLIVLEVATRFAPRPSYVAWGSALAAPILLGLAPLTTTLPVDGMMVALTGYATRAGGSIFPVVPWAAHMLAGVAVGAYCWPAGAATSARTVTGRLLAMGGLLLGAGLFLGPTWVALEPCVPLGAVLVGTALIAAISHDIPRLRRPLERLASESLSVYVFHILVVYGAGLGLAARLGPRQSWPASIAYAATLLVLSALVAWGWSHVKERRAARWRGRRRSTPLAA